MILGSDGQKLSKRHGSVSVLEYQKKGYLPQAIKNYLARLGWSHGDDEIFSMDQFSQWFDLRNITSSPAQFNDEKLNWLNNQYIREMDDESIFNLMIDFFKFNDIDELSKQKLIKGIALYKERVNNLVELSNQILFIIERPHIMPELIKKYLDADRLNLVKGLNSLLDEVKWEDEEINSLIKKFVAANQLKFPLIAMPLRVILTGSDHTPSIASIMSIIGREETKQRILKYIY